MNVQFPLRSLFWEKRQPSSGQPATGIIKSQNINTIEDNYSMDNHCTMALIFRLFRLPEVGAREMLRVEKGEAARHKHLVLEMVAIFLIPVVK